MAQNDQKQDYVAERESVRDVYEAMRIVGRCLDIGGHQGRLRAYLSPDQECVSVGPFLDIVRGSEFQNKPLEAFHFLAEPVNFICAFSKHLPFRSDSFDTAHMRSCVDHFYNPELALLGAYRVLKSGGQLIVGLYVEGGRTGKLTAREVLKERVRKALSLVTDAYSDHHIWHPTYVELCELISGCGFHI